MVRAFTVLTHNLLAPVWAIPRHYPHHVHHLLAKHDARREASFRNLEMNEPDIVLLQEVTEPVMDRLEERFGDRYQVSRGYHNSRLWRDWSERDCLHGLVTMQKKESLTLEEVTSVPLSLDGNCALCVHLKWDNTELVCVNSHLETLSSEVRREQTSKILEYVADSKRVICGGDFNEPIRDNSLLEHGFCGRPSRYPTVFDLDQVRCVDYVVTRGIELELVDDSQPTTLKQCLVEYGSDHLPVLYKVVTR